MENSSKETSFFNTEHTKKGSNKKNSSVDKKSGFRMIKPKIGYIDETKRKGNKKTMRKLKSKIIKKSISPLLEGCMYIWRESKWELTFLAIFSFKEDSLALVELELEGNKRSIRSMSILDVLTLRKQDTIQLDSGPSIYPFSIFQHHQYITLAAKSRHQQAEWISLLVLCVTKCPVNLNAYIDPCVVCSTKYDIIAFNARMLDFFDAGILLGKKISSIIPLERFDEFTQLCGSFLNKRDGSLFQHVDFPFVLKLDQEKESFVAFHINLLKNDSHEYMYLCRLVATSLRTPESNSVYNSLNEICRDPVIAMLDCLHDLSKEYVELRKLAASSDESSGSIEDPSRELSHASLYAGLDADSDPTIARIKELIEYDLPSLRRSMELTKERIPYHELDRLTLSRTDGFTLSSSLRDLLLFSRKPSLASEKPWERWNSMQRRVTVIGGGNVLTLGMHLAITGSLVTVAEFQEGRAEQINENQWHMLDEMSSSPCNMACASLLLDSLGNKLEVTPICATTNLDSIVAYTDIIIIETPYPFDQLFLKQMEILREKICPGQLILCDCSYKSTKDFPLIIKSVLSLLPNATMLCFTSCGESSVFEDQFHSKLGKPNLQNGAIESLITECTKEYLQECINARIVNLISSPLNMEVALPICNWLLQLSNENLNANPHRACVF